MILLPHRSLRTDTLFPSATLVRSTPGVVLAILTADCLPGVVAARDGSEVGAAHAGWRGLAAGVLEETVAAMRTKPGDIVAWLGPAAGPQAYEIGAEVFETFVSRNPRARAAFTATRPGHWHRTEEQTSELPSLMPTSYAALRLKKHKQHILKEYL